LEFSVRLNYGNFVEKKSHFLKEIAFNFPMKYRKTLLYEKIEQKLKKKGF